MTANDLVAVEIPFHLANGFPAEIAFHGSDAFLREEHLYDSMAVVLFVAILIQPSAYQRRDSALLGPNVGVARIHQSLPTADQAFS